MKIEKIMADNFLRLNLFEANLSDATLHLFAGNNSAGKSSVQEAVRFGLTGETVRVSKKGDYKLMIRDGAKAGSVSIDVDGFRFSRNIKDAKPIDGEDFPRLPEYLPYLLDAQRFSHTNNAMRRTFLLELTGTSAEPDDIARRMKAKGVHENCIEKVKPLLRAGIDAGHKEAVDRATEARAQWCGLTGQSRYGSQIAADWKAHRPRDFDANELLDGEQGMADLQDAIDGINIRKGGLVSKKADAIETMEAQGKAVKFDEKGREKLLKEQKKLRAQLEKMENENKLDNESLANARERVPVPCCECGALLRVSFHGAQVDVTPFVGMADDDQSKLQARIINRGCDISDLKKKLTRLAADIVVMNRAEAISLGGSEKVTQESIDEMQEKIDAFNLKISELTERRTALDSTLINLRSAAEKLGNATQTEERAQSLHRAVQAWSKCVESLAPDGIPAEILSDTLKPVNDRLRNTANLTGWPQTTISPTMDIEADGRPYQLLGESARWRADAAIADAISHLSEIGILILDRIDVLDIPSRGSLIKWMESILDEYDTILLFGTLKTLPSLPEGMKALWIENGEIKEIQSC